jgi:hypothetical protein
VTSKGWVDGKNIQGRVFGFDNGETGVGEFAGGDFSRLEQFAGAVNGQGGE